MKPSGRLKRRTFLGAAIVLLLGSLQLFRKKLLNVYRVVVPARLEDLFGEPYRQSLLAVISIVLPTKTGPFTADEIFSRFRSYVEHYDPPANLPSAKKATTGAAMVEQYAKDLRALDEASLASGAGRFVTLSAAEQERVVREFLETEKPNGLVVPYEPFGDNLFLDLLSFFALSPEVFDSRHGAEIGYQQCRGLDGLSDQPKELK